MESATTQLIIWSTSIWFTTTAGKYYLHPANDTLFGLEVSRKTIRKKLEDPHSERGSSNFFLIASSCFTASCLCLQVAKRSGNYLGQYLEAGREPHRFAPPFQPERLVAPLSRDLHKPAGRRSGPRSIVPHYLQLLLKRLAGAV